MAETWEAGARRSNENTLAGLAYDVFVSFRGPDTRHSITDVLYLFMKEKGIRVFRDTEEIRHGEEIRDELSQAILDSRVYVVVFSKDYATSVWCLRELAMMVDCCGDKASGKVILPIFYKVSPSDVKLQTKLYRSALDKHRKSYKEGTDQIKYKEEDVNKWEEALKKAGGISGLEYKRDTGASTDVIVFELFRVVSWQFVELDIDWILGRKGKFVSDVVVGILNMLNSRDRPLPDHVIGMDDSVENVMDKLNLKSHHVRQVVMVHGMGGIGKTTLAKAVFHRISSQFDGCSFLADVRESLLTGKRGATELQKKLLGDILGRSSTEVGDSYDGMNKIKMRLKGKRVLVIFDDVSERRQLDELVGTCDFFGYGTRIIVTTRDRSVCKGLMRSNDVDTYEMEGMSDDHALQLFSRHAFGKEGPPDNFVALSKQVIRSTGNLPLALEVIGGHLFSESKEVWLDILKKLKRVPHKDVMKILRISYDGLEESEKQIFLDIACFSEYEMTRKYASYMWEACGFYPKSGLDVLHNRSLIKVLNDVDDNEDMFWSKKDKFWMHDLIREMGREIVCSESLLYSPGMRSRLWVPREAHNVVRQKEGTHRVLAIHLEWLWDKHSITGEELQGMSNLRFLSLDGPQLIGDFRNFRTKLMWLRWDYCNPGLNPALFKMDNLVILQISGRRVTDKSMEDLRMGNLRVLEIKFAIIKRMPNLSYCSKLELIFLQHCNELEELHSSIGILRDLKCLNIKYCEYLTRLPEELGSAKALQALILMHCYSIQELPESIGGLGDLRILRGIGTNIRKLPSSIGNLKSLEVLEIAERGIPLLKTRKDVPNLERCNLSELSCLRSLNLSGLDELGDLLGIEKLCVLEKLKLDVRGKPVLLSTQLGSLSRVKDLYLRSGDIPSIWQLPSSLRKLTLVGFRTEVQWEKWRHPSWLMLRNIWVDGQDNMRNLSCLTLENFICVRLSDFASLRLCYLHLKNCLRIHFSGVERMDLLEELIISRCYYSPSGIPDLSNLRRLKRMEFVGCDFLQSVPSGVGDCHLKVYKCRHLSSFEGPYRQYHNTKKTRMGS